MGFELRAWQVECLSEIATLKSALVEATPGAGKTYLSAAWIKSRLGDRVDKIIYVVPSVALRDGLGKALAKFGVQIHAEGVRIGSYPPRELDGYACTYQQLPGNIESLRVWARRHRVGIVLDEVHHASCNNKWGEAVDAALGLASASLLLTGTAFRPDGRRIVGVTYTEDGFVVPDFRYGYQRGVADGVVRPVMFVHPEGEATWEYGRRFDAKIADALPSDAGAICRTVFAPEATYLERILRNVHDKLMDLRRAGDERAGCLLVCRPGVDSRTEDGCPDDDRHATQVARVWARIAGEDPVVVTHGDAKAHDRIHGFREGGAKCIVAVRMISEGVDIPRLRVGALLHHTESELLFRQIVGRLVRQQEGGPDSAYFYMAKFPWMHEMATRIEAEARAALRAERVKEHVDAFDSDDSREPGPMFVPIGEKYEDGGATYRHNGYEEDELRAAARVRSAVPSMAGISEADIIRAIRAAQGIAPVVDDDPEPVQESAVKTRKALYKTANAYVKGITYSLPAGDDAEQSEHFKFVWKRIWKRFGIRKETRRNCARILTEDYPTETSEQVVAVAKKWCEEGMPDA